jgi:hypothetical protein
MSAPILLVAALLPLQAADASGGHWETVVSEDGAFSVEMPATPNFRSNRPGSGRNGQAHVVGKGYRSGTGSYIVQRADFPPNVVLGSDDSRLDSQRDELARQYGGNATGERKIQLDGGMPGREFTIRGRPRGEIGLVIVRVREYVVGRSVYALIVSSSVDGTLPEQTDRFLGSLKLIAGGATKPAAVAAAPAASAPPRRRTAAAAGSGPAESAIAGWGTAIDPDRDCKVHPEGETLVIDVPNKPHNLTPFSGLFNVPRVVREVEGDFELQVKVDGEFKPVGPAERLDDEPSNGAGLILLGEGQEHIILDRIAFLRRERLMTSVELAQRGPGGNRGRRNPQLGDGTTYLRLARKGNQILASVSSDGKEWKSLEPLESRLPARLKVGVVAINTSKQPFSATFSEFRLVGK